MFIYIYGRLKVSGNIARLIKNTQPRTTNKQSNCIFNGHVGNHIFVCAIKSIAAREEFLIDYNLKRINTNVGIKGVICIQFYPL